MAVERTFYCDGPDCERQVKAQRPRPPAFIVVMEFEAPELHFCGWDCILRYAGTKEPEEVIPSDA